MYIMERVATAILWLERRRENTDWDYVGHVLLVMFLVGLCAALAALFECMIRFADVTPSPSGAIAAVFVRWIALAEAVTLWVVLNVWRKIVRWAERPARVEKALRDSR